MNFSVITGFAAFVLYLAACLILYRQFRGQTVPSRASILIPGTLAVIAHAASLWQVMITTSGTVTNPQGAVLGAISVVAINQAAQMLPMGAGMYQLPPNAGQPQQMESPQVKQGFVEGSNVNAVLEMTRLIDIQRAYENSVKLMGSDDDLTRTAIQKLGRV